MIDFSRSKQNAIFAFDTNSFALMEKLNRIKVVLAEKQKTGKWLAESLNKDQSTVSKWCTNTSQPDLYTLAKIAELLDVNIKDLLNNR